MIRRARVLATAAAGVAVLASLAALGCSGGYHAQYATAHPDWDGVFPAPGNSLQEVLAALHRPRATNDILRVARLEILRIDVDPWETVAFDEIRSRRVTPSSAESYAVIAVVNCGRMDVNRRYSNQATAWYILPGNVLEAWEHYTWEEPCALFPDHRPATRAESIALERALVARAEARFPRTPGVALHTYQYGLALVRAGRIEDARKALAEADTQDAHIRRSSGSDARDIAAVADIIRLESGETIRSDPRWTRDAREGLVRALAASEGSAGGTRDAADSLVTLARYYFPSDRASSATGMDDIARAGPILRRALDIYERDPTQRRAERAEALAMLAETEILRGRAREAADLHRRALRLRERTLGPDHADVARSLRQYGGAQVDLGEFAAAADSVERAEAFWRRAPSADAIEQAELAMVRARLELARGRPDEARAALSRALENESDGFGRKNPWYTQLRHLLALAYAQAGDLDRAARELDIVLARYDAWLASTHPILGIAAHQRARIAEMQGDLASATSHQRRALTVLENYQRFLFLAGSEEQRRQAAAAVRPYADYSVSLGVAAAHPDGARLALAAILRSKGRILDAVRGDRDQLAEMLPSGERDELDRLAKARSEWARLAIATGRSGAGADADLEAAEREVQQLEAALAARAAALVRLAPPADATEVAAHLPEGAALVEFASFERPAPGGMLNRISTQTRGERRYAACVLRRDAAVGCVDLGPADRIDAGVARFRAAVGAPAGPDPRPAARALDELMMRPVRALLGSETNLFVSPDGALNLVAFGALRDENDRYLVDRFTLHHLTTGRDLVSRAKRATAGRDVIVADPDFDGDSAGGDRGSSRSSVSATLRGVRFERLEGTALEAREVAALLAGAAVFTDGEARESAIMSLESPRVLHVATHGYFIPSRSPKVSNVRRVGPFVTVRAASADEPMLRAGLALTGANRRDDASDDGLLTAAELAHVDLRGTELVVLSACDTGLGALEAGEGVYGLRRAVALAGAASQLVTLWKVNDDATRDLVVRYYTRLMGGAGRSEALRAVQLEFLNSPVLSHPYYWASFVPLGATGSLPPRTSNGR